MVRCRSLLAALLVLSVLPTASSAKFTVCNEYPFAINLAYGKHDGVGWTAYGWFGVSAGQCKVIDSSPIYNPYLYIYAESRDGEGSEGPSLFEGNRTRTVDMCVNVEKPFNIRNSGSCSATGYKKLPFHEINTGGYTQYRLRLYDTN